MTYNWKGYAAVLGGFLIHFTLGTLYTFGNMSPYVSSYLRYYGLNSNVTGSEMIWIFALSIFGQGSAMPLGGFIEAKIGTRFTALLGSWFMSLGVILSFFTIKSYFPVLVLTYGFMFGLGTGLTYAIAIASSMSWFPAKKGLVGGIVVAGFGGGSLVFDQLQTLYINPNNMKPNVTVGNDKFFDQPEILHRVPSCFLFLGFTYAIIQLIGVVLLNTPSQTELDELHYYEDFYKYQPLRQELVESDESMPRNVEEKEVGETDSVASAGSPSRRRELQVPPSQMLKQYNFWIIWATFFVNSQVVIFLSTLYKQFGLYLKYDDHFLAIVGSVAAVFNAGGRIVWGHLHDFSSYRILMFILTVSLAVFLGTFILSSYIVGEWFYMIYVCVMFGLFSGNFALFPAVCSRLFGQKHMTVNYGLVFTANAAAGVIGAFLSTILLHRMTWLAIFLMAAGFSVCGSILTLLFRNTVPSHA